MSLIFEMFGDTEGSYILEHFLLRRGGLVFHRNSENEPMKWVPDGHLSREESIIRTWNTDSVTYTIEI